MAYATAHNLFQSTLPVRGATYTAPDNSLFIEISIHAPRAGSDKICKFKIQYLFVISIHAPRAGSDVRAKEQLFILMNFNPRSPCGERRYNSFQIISTIKISIHAPRAGSDMCADDIRELEDIFQSTLPVRGATPSEPSPFAPNSYFNPRSPCGERPENEDYIRDNIRISIHAPRAGSDAAGHARLTPSP